MKKMTAVFLAFLFFVFSAGAEDMTFDSLSKLQWSFSSGVGGWSTDMQISSDGAFSGTFHDSEMGEEGEAYPNGTVYVCSFTGQMSVGQQADEHSYELKIDRLTVTDAPGQESIEDGIRYVTSEPYGISEGDVMRLYLPGTPVDALTDDMRMWAHLFDLEEAPAELTNYFLYSEKNESGFVGYVYEETAYIANPWKDMTEEELSQVSGLSFGVPEGAENVVYRWLENDSLAEMQFTLDSDEYIARVKPAALQEGEIDNISGMYFYWDNEEKVQIKYCDGRLYLAQTGSEDWVELCLWYDAAPGLMYSLSVYTTDPDGLDLTAVAEMVFLPVQGDV